MSQTELDDHNRKEILRRIKFWRDRDSELFDMGQKITKFVDNLIDMRREIRDALAKLTFTIDVFNTSNQDLGRILSEADMKTAQKMGKFADYIENFSFKE